MTALDLTPPAATAIGVDYVIRLKAIGAAYPCYLTPLGTGGAPMGGKFEQAAKFKDMPSALAALGVCSAHNLIGDVHPIERVGDETFLLDEVASNRPLPTVELLRTKGPAHYIVALANSFPCLRGKVEGCGITPQNWDVDFWMRAQRPWSHGEKCAAVFVAVVWNYSDACAKKWRFDAIDAVSVWDRSCRAAFLAWAKSPVWP